MNKPFLRFFFFVLFVLCAQTIWSQIVLKGLIVDDEAKPIPYAHIELQELELSTVTNSQGRFAFKNLQKGYYTLLVSALDYIKHKEVLILSKDTELKIPLKIRSYRLSNVVVMAQYKRGVQTINRTAMEHIQPNSLGDVFQLLPGKLTRDGSMNEVDQIASRQVGTDKNTALGTAIYTDGVPMSNDVTLHRVMGDQKQRKMNTVNGGIDLRKISTDHLEKVDVMQGIPSAKYGNLTSGVVVAKTKSGVSPVSVRLKADPNTKLFYLGKGFKMPKNGGSLYVGADYTFSKPSVRETLTRFNRYTAMANYTNSQDIAEASLSYGLQLSYIGTLDGQKTDKDLDELINDYRDLYNRFSISHDMQISTQSKFLKSLDWNIAFSYTNDFAIRDLVVSPGGTTPLPLSTESGEYEGEYLPVEYVTQYTLDDKPISFFSSIAGKSLYGKDDLRGFLDWGLDYSYERNIGEGYKYDIHRPPFPLTPMSSRPRAYKDLPSYQRLSAFVENTLDKKFDGHSISLKTGLRFSGMPAIDRRYKQLRGKVFFEPRINFVYTFPQFTIAGKRNVFSFRLGYGRGVKYPTLDLLEPSIYYRDLKSFNYFATKPEDRYLLITTIKEEAKNNQLTTNVNNKYELEFLYKLGKARFEIVAFYEEDRRGFVYASMFDKVLYNVYKYNGKISHGNTQIDKNLLEAHPTEKLYEYLLPENGELVRKLGLEYNLSIPKIKAIQTSIAINGAYYRTYYDVSKAVLRKPDVRIDGKDYPYVAYYGHERANYKTMVNTNFWFNTHIPRYGLIFTSKFQFIWFQEYADRWYDGVPEYYFGIDMNKKPYLKEYKEDEVLRHLVLTKPDIFFKPDVTPLRASIDLKVSKDVTSNIRISFFVNRLVFFSPAYFDKFGIYDKIRQSPYFGSEINIKI